MKSMTSFKMIGLGKTEKLSRDKTMADKIMYIPNGDTQNYHLCRLQLVVELFGYSTSRTNQSKFIKSPQSC